VPWLVDVNARLGIPSSLDAVGIAEDALGDVARECLEAYPRPNHPVAVDQDRLEALLRRFHVGDAAGAWNDAARSHAAATAGARA
jgi:alcohol dehydrogenase class IV